MKFVVYEGNDTKYYEAPATDGVYRQLISHRTEEYVLKIFKKSDISVATGMTIINYDIFCDIDDDDEYNRYEGHEFVRLNGLDYINLSVKVLDELYQNYLNSGKDDRALRDNLNRLLSDEAFKNLFLYFMTPGEGDQKGIPYKEHISCIIQEYPDS